MAKFWCIPVTEELDRQVEEALSRDTHVSKSEFVRDVVRRHIDKINIGA